MILMRQKQAIQAARIFVDELLTQPPSSSRQVILELIQTILVYKLPHKTIEEVAAMLGLGDLTQTRFYQEAFQRGEVEGEKRGKLKVQLESAPRLLAMGLSPEQVAEALGLTIKEVETIAQNLSTES
jgi:predicted transposase/invertase (TIGR01784 family)